MAILLGSFHFIHIEAMAGLFKIGSKKIIAMRMLNPIKVVPIIEILPSEYFQMANRLD